MVVNIDKFIDASEASAIGGGLAVGEISWSPQVVQDISGPTSRGTLPASAITTHDHADAVTAGLKFEFTVPEDYDSGPIKLQAVYAMSTAVAAPNNIIVLNIGAEIADVTGGSVDTVTYAPAPLSVITPNNLTNVTRSPTVLTIADGDFAVGDKIVFLVERLGANGSDLHTGSWKLIDYLVIYDGQIASRAAVHQVESFSDTGGTPAVPGTKSSFDTLDFQEGFTHEQKFQWTIPDNWDGSSDFQIRFTYAMTSALAAAVRLNVSGQVASVTTGAVTTLPTATSIVTTPANTGVHRTLVSYSIANIGRAAGDTVVIIVNRPSGDALDTHTGNWQLIAATVFIGQGGSTPIATEFDEFYLTHRNFRIVTTSGVNGEQESPAFAGNFELWAIMDSTVPFGRIDVEWQGRLRAAQSKITSIIIPIRGQSGGPTPQYQVKIYAEGSAGTPVYTGPLTAETTGNRTLVTLTDVDLSAQPTGEKRYFVVVEAYLDNTEVLRVGTPFVRQE